MVRISLSRQGERGMAGRMWVILRREKRGQTLLKKEARERLKTGSAKKSSTEN